MMARCKEELNSPSEVKTERSESLARNYLLQEPGIEIETVNNSQSSTIPEIWEEEVLNSDNFNLKTQFSLIENAVEIITSDDDQLPKVVFGLAKVPFATPCLQLQPSKTNQVLSKYGIEGIKHHSPATTAYLKEIVLDEWFLIRRSNAKLKQIFHLGNF